MGTAALDTAAAGGSSVSARHAASERAGDAAAAWIALIPTAALAVVSVIVLGPKLGHLLLPSRHSTDFWPGTPLLPEPVEQGRYLVLVMVALLFAPVIVVVSRWRDVLPQSAVTMLTRLVQLAMLAFFTVCWVEQHRKAFGGRYFTNTTLLAALAITAVVIAGARVVRARGIAIRLLQETTGRRIASLVLAGAITAIWLLHAINSDHSIAWANSVTHYHVQFPLDETFAVVNGLTPLVNFTPQYSSLWPYAIAGALLVFGKSLLVFTIAMCSLTTVSLLAVFGALRRAARSSLAALLLYLPLMATSFFFLWSDSPDRLVNRHTFGSYFPVHPLRYAGPYLLAWLTARQADTTKPRLWVVFAVAAAVAVNNSEFGTPAFAATIAACLATTSSVRGRQLGRLALEAAAGTVAAVLLVSVITLTRTGHLPAFTQSTEFAHVYLVNGFSLIPLAGVLGLHLIIFATYVACIGAATVRRIERMPNRALTAMLAWSGVFGMLSAEYYIGRSALDTLPMTFSAWAFSLALLTILSVRQIAARRRGLPSAAAVVVVFGMSVMACSLAQLPLPWEQVARIEHPPSNSSAFAGGETPYVAPENAAQRFFISSIADGPHRFVVRHGAPVALFLTMGHRFADAYGIRDVVPFTGMDSIQTRSQFELALDALRSAGGNTLILPEAPRPGVDRVLTEHGFEIATRRGLRRWDPRASIEGPEGAQGMTKWVDVRALRASATRPISRSARR